MNPATHVQAGTARRSKASRMTVAEYLNAQINLSDKTQAEIALECGFNKPNIISMFKSGQTKLPVAKIGTMAKALNIDPIHLFRMVMEEYEPDTWKAIEEGILTHPLISDNEHELIRVARKSGYADQKLTADEKKQLAALLSTFGAHQA